MKILLLFCLGKEEELGDFLFNYVYVYIYVYKYISLFYKIYTKSAFELGLHEVWGMLVCVCVLYV